MTAPIHHTSRPRHSAGHSAGDPGRAAGRPPEGTGKRSVLQQIWRQLPFFVWLIALWMLLWGQFTVLAFVTGLIAAVAVTRVFRLPPVELSGRVNLWYGLVFVLSFLGAVVRGSLTVAWQVLDLGRQPGTAIIAVPLRIDDDLIMTHTAVTASLIPGSLIVDADRDRRILYLHVIGVRSEADVEAQRESVLAWERRIVRAVGSRAQVALVIGCRGRGIRGGCVVNILLIAIYVVFGGRRAAHAVADRRRPVDPRPGGRLRRAAHPGDVRARRRDGDQPPHPHAAGAADHRRRRGVRLDLDRAVRREEGQRRPMIDMDAALDATALVLILLGALLCLTAAIGLLRFRDVPTRLHAATKPQVLGLILICLAIALSLRSWPVVAFLVPVVLIQLATAPLSAHMVGRQAYRNGTIDERSLFVDELAESKQTPPAAGG